MEQMKKNGIKKMMKTEVVGAAFKYAAIPRPQYNAGRRGVGMRGGAPHCSTCLTNIKVFFHLPVNKIVAILFCGAGCERVATSHLHEKRL
jgi:hypothetical protein